MKYKELAKKSEADRKKELENAQQELLKLRAQVATGSAGKDAGKIRELKRTIARIKTMEVNTEK